MRNGSVADGIVIGLGRGRRTGHETDGSETRFPQRFERMPAGCRARGRVGIEIAPESQERTSSVSQNQTRCGTRHRSPARSRSWNSSPSGQSFKVVGFGSEPVPSDTIVDGAIIDAAAVADAVAPRPRRQPHQDEGRRRLALRQRRHRQEDQSAGDDRGRTLRVDSLGSRAVHPVRHPGRQPRLPDPLHPSWRREGQHGSAARGGQEGQDRRLHRRHQQGRPDAGRRRRRRLCAAERLRGELRRRAGRGGRAAQRRRERREHQHRLRRPVAVHPRHLDGRQRLHRGDPEGTGPALRQRGAREEGRADGRRRSGRGRRRSCEP